jgi:hypothetical protein
MVRRIKKLFFGASVHNAYPEKDETHCETGRIIIVLADEGDAARVRHALIAAPYDFESGTTDRTGRVFFKVNEKVYSAHTERA